MAAALGNRVRQALAVFLAVVALLGALATIAVPPEGAWAAAGAGDGRGVSTTREVVGRSVEGRPIVAYRRRGPYAVKRVLVVGSMHGDEPAGLRVVRGLRSGPVPANVDLWLVPTVNPDGLARQRRTNARGVDLNRNFPHRWRRAGQGTETYSGPRRASEPETRALVGLTRRIRPTLTVVFHQPFGGVGKAPKAMDVVRALARQMRYPVESYDCGGGCHGTYTSWHNKRFLGVAVTVEFGYRVSRKRIGLAEHAVLRVGSRR